MADAVAVVGKDAVIDDQGLVGDAAVGRRAVGRAVGGDVGGDVVAADMEECSQHGQDASRGTVWNPTSRLKRRLQTCAMAPRQGTSRIPCRRHHFAWSATGLGRR